VPDRESSLATAWQRNTDANLYLLDHLQEKSLANRYSPRTRTVSAQLAHMHNVRLLHLNKRGPEFMGRLQTFDRGAQPNRSQIVAALTGSAKMMGAFLEASERTGLIQGWNGPPSTFLAYLIAHEAHHRALIVVSMRISGEKLPKEAVYNIWSWG
jgi:uncharacterized damage-inducible protein DinB